MKRRLIAASAILLVAATSAYETALTEKQVEGVETTIKAIGCTVEADDVDTTDDGYEADDGKCKDGEFEVTFDKDFNIKSKEKDEY